MCGLYVTWTGVQADFGTALAYMGIPIMVLWILRRSRVHVDNALIIPALGFVAFILLCGLHHASLAWQGLCLLLQWDCPDLSRFHDVLQIGMEAVSISVLLFLFANRKMLSDSLGRFH